MNGLLLIDDNKDADHGDNREVQRDFAKEMKHAKSEDALKKIFAVAWKSTSDEDVKGGYKDLYEARKIEFSTEITAHA